MQDTIVILDEGDVTYPRCPKCDMFVSQKALNNRHLLVAFCCRVEESNKCRMAEEKAREGTERLITDYSIPLSPFTSFKYLGRFLLEADNDWTELVHNLLRSCQKWAHLSWVISR